MFLGIQFFMNADYDAVVVTNDVHEFPESVELSCWEWSVLIAPRTYAVDDYMDAAHDHDKVFSIDEEM